MIISQFDYRLPKELIAQTPIRPRDHSRLLVYERKTGKSSHQHFCNLPKFLRPGDLLVFNDTKVFKARLFGRLQTTDYGLPTRIEVFLLKSVLINGAANEDSLQQCEIDHSITASNKWEILAKPGRKLKIGSRVVFAKNFWCEVIEKKSNGIVIVRFNQPTKKVMAFCQRAGHIPVPPYIKNEPAKLSDYQTVYARHSGSVAAPTAGFHFTPRLFQKLKKMGVQTTFVTLHVGLGTFQLVKTSIVEEHQMHSEWVEISSQAADAINRAKQEGRRVIAVGTTTVRALEGVARKYSISNIQYPKNFKDRRYLEINRDKIVRAYRGDIGIFITPGFQFRVIDGLITNFHLPKSTLLMLVSAFVGSRPKTLQIYQKAVELKYRFYSFGDAMFIC